jgi:hypothetical protein
MGFWLNFAKKIIDKAIADVMRPGERQERTVPRCTKCGRLCPPESLVNGECLICRISEEQQKQRDHSREAGKEKKRDGDDLGEAYKILGCSETDSDDHIKRQYRKIVKECHVDSLPKDLPDYLVQAVNARFREVREAYERVMKARESRN